LIPNGNDRELQPIGEQPTLEELVAQITPENRYRETDWGPDRGKELFDP
jgi:antitoxin component of MazEF toxin-antitoxin module